MANLEIKDGAAVQKYVKSSGAGSIGDPFIPEHLDTNSAAIKTAVELIDNAIAGTEMQVDVITMPTVTISDGGGSITIDGTISVSALPAGTNNIGDVDVLTLPALAAGTNNIGDVDILTIAAGDNNIGNVDVVTLPALPAGTNNIGDVDVLTLPGTAAEATALPSLRVVVAADDGVDTHTLQTDASGNLKVNIQAGSSAGTEYTEGAIDTTITGTAILGEGPSDTLTPLKLDASSNLYVNVAAGGTSGVQYTEADIDATITGTAVMWEDASDTLRVASATKPLPTAIITALPAGTSNIGDVDILTIAAGDNNIGNVDIVTVPADPFGATADAAVTAGATGSISAKLRSISRDLVANVVLAAGANAIGKLAANTGVDIGDVDVLSVVPGTSATSLGKAEDAVHTSGDTGVMDLSVRKDTATALAGTDGDYQPLITDASGRLHVTVGNIAAGTAHIGAVGSSDTLIEVAPTMDTSAYASGDVLISETDIASAGRATGTTIILQSLLLVDKDDQKAAMTFYFFDRTVTFGTKNAAPTISDADAAFYMGHVDVLAGDWDDLGGVSVATLRGIGLEMKPNATSIFFTAITGGTPTHTASGLICKFGFLRS